MIIVSITGPTVEGALDQVSVSSVFADIFEFRLDMIQHPDLARLFSATTKPVIATCRPVWEGGEFRGREDGRIELLRRAVRHGARFVDIEVAAGRRAVKEFVDIQPGLETIVSCHRTERRQFDVEGIYRRLRATGAHVLKFAYPVRDLWENVYAIRFLRQARNDRQRAVAVAMGERGEISRILYRKFGGWATFAAAETGKGAAPGQLTAGMLKGIYRSDRLKRTTKVFGVLGNPLRQSKGIFVHNEHFRAKGKNAVYCRFPVADLRKFARDILPIVGGLSVTIPYKQDVLKYVDRLDRKAKAIGAANTVLRRGGALFATNTDAAAALDAIEQRGAVRGKTILVVGAGGAARAVAYEARERGANVIIANRTYHRARRLAKEFGVRSARLSDLPSLSFDILVNATSVGMYPDVEASPVPPEILGGKVVMDAVYAPVATRLLRDAEGMGAVTIPGTEMYINQAARQARLFLGALPDVALIRKVLLDNL